MAMVRSSDQKIVYSGLTPTMRLSEKQQIFSVGVARLILWLHSMGYATTFGEAYRTPRQQKWYFDEGHSKTLKSKHLNRLAIDLMLFRGGVYLRDSDDYKPAGEYWESMNPSFKWGGNFENFKDGNHFEHRG
jgi:hypothetical protein